MWSPRTRRPSRGGRRGAGRRLGGARPRLLVLLRDPASAGAGAARGAEETKARKVLSLNLAPQPGETDGFSPQRHLEVLARHAPKLAFDVVLADKAAVPDIEGLTVAAKQLVGSEVELAAVAAQGDDARSSAGEPRPA